MKENTLYVGHNIARVDAIEKVTGRAKYTGDLAIAGMLHGKILRSPLPHARIKKIDAARAASLAGVAAVLTAADLADLNPYYSGRPLIAIDKVRYAGEPVAAVAAETPQAAAEAVSLIEVEYEELPAFVGLDAALKGADPLIHADAPRNICSHERVEQGNIDQGFAESDEIFEDVFVFPMVYHYAMEPHTVIAEWTDDGIRVWSSAQHPFQVRADLAKIFRVRPAQVQMIIPYLGGGFGSKSYTKFEPLVVALARKAKRPVRIANSVSESMLTVRRHAARVRLKTGVKRDGTLVAREAEIFLDTGGYADNGPAVAARAATRVLGPYRIPHIRSDAYAVYTNSGSAGSFRAIGAPQSLFACESQMDIIAAALKMDPAELRLKNMLRKGEKLQPKLRGMDANLAMGLKKLLAASRWKSLTKKKAAVGLACGATNAGANPISVAMVRLQPDGSVAVFAGSTEMGQGVRTVLSQIVAEELRLPVESVKVVRADTTVTPYDNSTGSSRSTTLMGTAVQNAARDLKKQLLAIAAAAFKTKPSAVRLDRGALTCGEARLTFAEAVQKRFGANAGELIGRGDVGPEITDGLPVFWEIGMGVAEVELDRETGRIGIKRYVSLADVGKAIHPAQCVGQEEGAAMMGIGHTLFEEMIYQDGQLANSTLLSYRVPRFSDVPDEFHTILLENRDGPGPFGARGMGEGGLLSVAPSVTNALARGIGLRLKELPLTPERVWRALKDVRELKR
ncbi:MAG TPA: xanthine dehydrogenase family protein molybdopterin-binding subunit [Candidatus Acidoferrales bacterium]|nr:xanthine dehydrogenase family protein molybdopterin-binding subunit [Candidatus Acidoferrales bacterium]